MQSYTVQEVKQIADGFTDKTQSEAVRGALQALTACAGASSKGGDCSQGAMGAASAVVLANVIGAMEGEKAIKEWADGQNNSKDEEDDPITKEGLFSNIVTNLIVAVTEAAGGDAVVAGWAGKTEVENNYLNSKEARQLDKELAECKASGGDCKSVVEKYLDISNKNSKELAEACTGGGVVCVTWEEYLQASTNVANDPHPNQFRLDEKLKDPDAATIVNYLNSSDLNFLKDNITEGDRLLSVISDPTSWPFVIMGGRAIITNAVNNTKEQLIAVGAGVGLGASIQYGTTGEVKLSDLIGLGLIGGITAGKGYNQTVTWNAVGGYYQAEIRGDDPFISALLSKGGASVGYSVGNVLKIPFDKKLNPISKQYEWVPTGIWTITKPLPQHPLPSIIGNIGNFAASGLTPEILNDSEDK